MPEEFFQFLALLGVLWVLYELYYTKNYDPYSWCTNCGSHYHSTSQCPLDKRPDVSKDK